MDGKIDFIHGGQKMRKKLIFFDIDGTLLDEKTGKIPDSAVEAVRKARENGHLAFINSGRTASFIGGETDKIEFDGKLCGCGTYIEYQGKVLEHRTLSKELQDKVLKLLRECHIDAVVEGRYRNYFDIYEKICVKEFRDFAEKYPFPCGTWEDEDIDFDKFFMYKTENSDFERFHKELEKYFDFIDREQGFYEVLPKGCSKADSIRYMVDYLGMSMEDTIAFGDSSNDVPMLECANISVGMGNGSKCVLDMVSFVTKSVVEDGIRYAMEHFELI